MLGMSVQKHLWSKCRGDKEICAIQRSATSHMAPETALSLLGIEQGTFFEMMGQCGLRSLRYISHNIPGAMHVYYIQFNREAGFCI